MRRRYPGSHMVKEFARVRVLVRLGIHVHQTSPDWNEYNRKRTRVSYSEDDLAGAPFHLNHYPIQSRESRRPGRKSKRAAAPPRRRGCSVETSRGDADVLRRRYFARTKMSRGDVPGANQTFAVPSRCSFFVRSVERACS